MVRIDINLFDDAAQSKLHDAPIVSGCPAAPCFPAVHPFATVGILVRDENSATGFEEVFFLSEEFVVREEHGTTQSLGGEIDEAGGSGFARV
jgi:hypothetical protein